MSTKDAIHSSSSRKAASETSGFATAIEAATFLRVSKAMIHRLIGDGTVPARRYGRAVRIPWSWLNAQAANYEARSDGRAGGAGQ